MIRDRTAAALIAEAIRDVPLLLRGRRLGGPGRLPRRERRDGTRSPGRGTRPRAGAGGPRLGAGRRLGWPLQPRRDPRGLDHGQDHADARRASTSWRSWSAALAAGLALKVGLRRRVAGVEHRHAGARAAGITPGVGIGVEAVLTALLVLAVIGTAVDPRAPKIGGLAIGLAVAADILVGGPLTGAAMNPARWFGPAVAAGAYADWYVWWIGPAIGAAVAALHLPVHAGRGDLGTTKGPARSPGPALQRR